MIVVTGGAGFIGSAVVWALNLQGQTEILVVDHLESSTKWRNLRGLQFADYLEKHAFEAMLDEGRLPWDCEAIIHLGACSSTTEKDASYLIANNYQYTQKISVLAAEMGTRFVYASSAATYGGLEQVLDDDEEHLPELRPLNAYGWSKQIFDHWALRQGLLSEIAGLKFSNVFGPNEEHKGDMRSMVHRAWGQAREQGVVRLFASDRPDYADGEQRRDFVYVKDVAAMVLHFLEHRELHGIFNVGSGVASTWNELATAVFTALEQEPRIEYFPMPEHLRGQYQYFTKLRMDKLRASGYTRPMTPLADAVADYVQHYLEPGRWLDANDPGRIPLA